VLLFETTITESGITGVGTRDAGTSELLNLRTVTLENGITGGSPPATDQKVLTHSIQKNPKDSRDSFKRPHFRNFVWEIVKAPATLGYTEKQTS
jgi:hypothetical protein